MYYTIYTGPQVTNKTGHNQNKTTDKYDRLLADIVFFYLWVAQCLRKINIYNFDIKDLLGAALPLQIGAKPPSSHNR